MGRQSLHSIGERKVHKMNLGDLNKNEQQLNADMSLQRKSSSDKMQINEVDVNTLKDGKNKAMNTSMKSM